MRVTNSKLEAKQIIKEIIRSRVNNLFCKNVIVIAPFEQTPMFLSTH